MYKHQVVNLIKTFKRGCRNNIPLSRMSFITHEQTEGEQTKTGENCVAQIVLPCPVRHLVIPVPPARDFVSDLRNSFRYQPQSGPAM